MAASIQNSILTSNEVEFANKSSGRVDISHNLLYATQSLIRTYVQDAYFAYQHGRKSFFENNNISKELVSKIQFLQPFEIDQLAQNYARYILSNQQDGIVLDVNKALISVVERCSENELADNFLMAGASNIVMQDYFCMRSVECSLRRSRLGITLGRGRKIDPKGEGVLNEICGLYDKAIAETQCPRQSLLSVHKETGHYIDFIHRALEKNKEYAL